MSANRHHYVSRFYLRRFLEPKPGPDGRRLLWVYRTEQSKPERVSPRRVAQATGYNLIEAVDGSQHQIVEQLFASMETQLGHLLPVLGHPSYPLRGIEREVIAQFLAAMYLRGPRARDLRNFAVREDLRASLDRLRRWFEHYEEPERSAVPPIQEIEEAMQSGSSLDTFTLSQNAQLIWMLQEIPELERTILATKWSYFVAPADSPFVTSEAPITIYFPRNPKPIASANDLQEADAELMFPLSPRICLVTSWHHPEGLYEEPALDDGPAVLYHNFLTAHEAILWGLDVYGSSPTIPFPDRMWDPIP